MKLLKDMLLEASILGDIDDRINNMDSETIKVAIREFVDRTYFCRQSIVISDKPNKDGKYVLTASGSVEVKDRQIDYLTNGMFVWGNVGAFDCSYCENLKSLEGSPKKVQGYFICNNCKNLTSLKGCPKVVGKRGIIGCFDCYACSSLKSLEHCPNRVYGDFDCRSCGKIFTTKYVKNLCKVENKIFTSN